MRATRWLRRPRRADRRPGGIVALDRRRLPLAALDLLLGLPPEPGVLPLRLAGLLPQFVRAPAYPVLALGRV